MKKVVVIFQASQGRTERLALALGLGALQAGADIRYRHLAPSADTHLQHQDYGRLKDGDLHWAEVLAVVLESNQVTGLEELTECLKRLPAGNTMPSKVARILSDDPRAESALYLKDKVQTAGVRLLPEEDIRLPLTPESLALIGSRLSEIEL